MSEVAIVTCLFNGTKTDVKLPYGAFHYDTSWVDKLYRQVQRNTTYKFDFICLVDEPDYVFHEPVQSVMLNNRRGGWVALTCLLYTSPSPRDRQKSRMPSSA